MATIEENELTARKLTDMRVVDLRQELEKRGLDKGGVKASLVERLTKALQDEGNDPEEYLFDVPAEGTPTKKPIAKRSNRKLNDSDSNFDSQEDLGNEEDMDRVDTDDEKNILESEEVVEDALQLSVGEEEKLNEEEENADSRGKDDTHSDIDGDAEPSLREGSLGQEDKNEEKTNEEGGVVDKSNGNNHCDKTTEASSEIVSVEVEDEEIDDTTKEQADCKNAEANKETEADDDTLQKGTEEEKVKNEEAGGKSSSETPAVTTTSASTTAGTSKYKSTTAKNATKVPSKDDKERPKREPQSTRNLWVSGLAPGTRATELKTLFSKQGKVVGAKIVTNARTPGARCYGFVTMATSEEASKCIQHLHRTELNGRIISVERTRHEPGGMLRRTETRTALAVKKLAQKREIKPPAKASEAAKAKEPVKSKDAEGEKPEQENDATKGTETEQEKEGERDGKERETSRDKSREREREKGLREPRSISRGRDYRSRPFGRPRDIRPFHMRGRGRGLRSMSFRDRHSMSFRKPYFAKRPFIPKPGFQPGFKPNIVAFQKIKHIQEERRRQRIREREIRENERRRAQEIFRQRSIERKQREESIRLERERERLRIEREKLERERAEVLRLEREKQRLERERLEREREELRRREQMSRIEEPRRAMKRPFRGGRENDGYWDDRKRASLSGRYHDYDNRERSYDRHDLFERRGERYEGREKALEVATREFGDVRREVRREQSTHDRDDRRVPERPERYNRNPSREADARAREHREIRDPGRGAPTRERERMGPPRSSPPVRARPPPRDDWKSQPHDRRIHERYMEPGKVMSGPGGSFSSSRSYGGDRGESWGSSADKGMGKSYSSGGVMGGGSQWGSADSRKLDSSHGQSWGRVENSQANRWGGSMESRNPRGQQGMGMGQAQPGMYGGNSQQMGSMASHSSISGSGYASDRYMTGMRRY